MAKQKFACSAVVTKPGKTNVTTFMVEANSLDEAVGIALRIARKLYLVEDGWTNHSVGACADTYILNPDLHIEPVKG